MRASTYILSITAAFVLLFASCKNKPVDLNAEGNSVYYWRTSFTLDSTERNFIEKHDIRRIYMRYFDVVSDGGQIMPNATISFEQKLPDNIEVVPVVYILNECLHYDVSTLGNKIVNRIIQMDKTNDIHNVKQIQIDCDWTARTQSAYFALLRDIRQRAASQSLKLSVTIRLHQLAMPVPPADNGTLMVYNTGDVKDIKCENPILQLKDVAPYLKYLTDYSLQMNVAYPIFSWHLLYRNNRFVGFMHGNDLETYPGDNLITRECSANDILKVKDAIDDVRSGINNNVIIYTLDKNNITRYKDDDIKEIFGN